MEQVESRVCFDIMMDEIRDILTDIDTTHKSTCEQLDAEYTERRRQMITFVANDQTLLTTLSRAWADDLLSEDPRSHPASGGPAFSCAVGHAFGAGPDSGEMDLALGWMAEAAARDVVVDRFGLLASLASGGRTELIARLMGRQVVDRMPRRRRGTRR